MPRTRMSYRKAEELRRRHREGESIGDLAREYGIAHSTASLIASGKRWGKTDEAKKRTRAALRGTQKGAVYRQKARTIAVDPSKRATGAASFGQDGQLEAVWFHPAKTVEEAITYAHALRLWNGRVPATVVVEKMQVYPDCGTRKANDLIECAMVGGAYAAIATNRLVTVTPHGWKGNRTKSADNAYTWRLLSPAERVVVERYKDNDNVMDAVGIGLWFLKRRIR